MHRLITVPKESSEGKFNAFINILPFYAIINYKLISSKHTPKTWRPSVKLHVLSWFGIVFLIGFSLWYLSTI